MNNFNADFFLRNNIYFGGGTRIALEINEFRESIDIDFLCPDRASYRAVREEVNNVSLGNLVKTEFTYLREISFNREGVRTFIMTDDKKIKLEIVSFDNYELEGAYDQLFPVPYINRETCFYTKLMANADRCMHGQCKDIFDLLAMYDAWGGLPEKALDKARSHYGGSINKTLHQSLDDIKKSPEKYFQIADDMLINKDFAEHILCHVAPKMAADALIK
ncbi:nucleotidyl transferase AbiEii/AbiGii toxin family protein [Pantoea sp. EEL5]|uniref:nucleotidyl transferase AbiEii/AbiGii toxin family protein n=1 Tax=Pantoea sp. EEL5 TaxID=3416806 RepID=UPI003CFB3997